MLSRNVLGQIFSAGLIGLATAFVFWIYQVPDLILTQLFVEAVTLVLLGYVFRYFILSKKRQVRWGVGILSILSGAVMACLAWISIQVPQKQALMQYFIDNSYLKAGGKNIVNVILVDFRGLDTMGEISVLGITAISVLGMFLGWKIQANQGLRSESILKECYGIFKCCF